VLSRSTTHSNATHAAIDYRVIVAVSLLLSLWLILLNPIINRDAILYLRTAEAYLQGGLLASFALFDRPFLSIIIALLHQLTGISLLHCGLLLSALFYALLSTTFVSIVRLLGGDRRIQIIAAIVILSHPMIATGRDSIMRDPPFWAFSLLAFRALLLYVRQPQLKHQFYWFTFVAIATVFRFEGLFFALLAPLAAYAAMEKGRRVKPCLRLLALPLAAVSIPGVCVLLLQTVWFPDAQLFPDIGGYVNKLTALPQVFVDVSTATGEALLVFTAKDDAGIAALAGLTAILLAHLIRAMMWPYIIVLIWGRVQNLYTAIPRQARILLNGHLLIGLLYLGLFTLTNRFMLVRYCHILTIFIALYLPFILNSAWAAQRRPLTKVLAILVLTGMSIDVAGHIGNRKIYIRNASEWVVENTPENATLVTNIKYLAYFSKRETEWRNLGAISFNAPDLSRRAKLWRNSDYIVVRVRSSEADQWSDFLNAYSMTELNTFDGGNYGKISIVAVPARHRVE